MLIIFSEWILRQSLSLLSFRRRGTNASALVDDATDGLFRITASSIWARHLAVSSCNDHVAPLCSSSIVHRLPSLLCLRSTSNHKHADVVFYKLFEVAFSAVTLLSAIKATPNVDQLCTHLNSAGKFITFRFYTPWDSDMDCSRVVHPTKKVERKYTCKKWSCSSSSVMASKCIYVYWKYSSHRMNRKLTVCRDRIKSYRQMKMWIITITCKIPRLPLQLLPLHQPLPGLSSGSRRTTWLR